MTRDYTEYPALSGVYLEDSYVLAISELPNEFRFSLEAVLTPESPSYRDPLPGEQYCYTRGQLIFPDVSRTEWISKSLREYTDAAGEEDLGNIDTLTNDSGAYTAEGDWGKVRIWTDKDPEFQVAD